MYKLIIITSNGVITVEGDYAKVYHVIDMKLIGALYTFLYKDGLLELTILPKE